MTAEDQSIINSIIEKTRNNEISWKMEGRCLIAIDEDNVHYCIEPYIDINDSNFPKLDPKRPFSVIAHYITQEVQPPKLTILYTDTTKTIEAEKIQTITECEFTPAYSADSEPEEYQIIQESLKEEDLALFHTLTSTALRSYIRNG